MKRLLVQMALIFTALGQLLLLGSLIEVLTPAPWGTVAVLLVMALGGLKLLEIEEGMQKEKNRCAVKNRLPKEGEKE